MFTGSSLLLLFIYATVIINHYSCLETLCKLIMELEKGVRKMPSKVLKEKYDLFINGKWVAPSSGEYLDVENPATGEIISRIANATEEDVDRAVKAAREAFKTWSKTTASERADLLVEISNILNENSETMARIESMDNGKPIRETSGADVPLAVDHFRYFAGVVKSDEGVATLLEDDQLNLILREPMGVVGQIVPWNFPLLMASWKIAPALAAGNTIVFKPSSSTPLSALYMAEIIQEVLPDGVFNLITGKGSQAGAFMQKHKDFDKLAFTGSTEVGRSVGISAAENLIPATLELGGKSANVFFNDADRDVALEGVQMGILFNQGQVCSAGSRIFVQDTFYDEFVGLMKEAFERVKVGDPLDPETEMGAQSSENPLNKILKYIEIGKEEGAEVLVGGERLTEGEAAKGYFMKPTLLVNVDNSMRVAREEIFGPVGVVIKFHDIDELIEMANDSPYGLAGGVFSQDINKIMKVARGIRTGRVWVNQYNSFPAGSPFGGYKESGIGRETHKSVLDAYSQMKNILIDLSGVPGGMFVTPKGDDKK